MTIKSCIMKAGDLILKEDVKSLTSEQWNKFRGYMKSFGYRIQNDFGPQTAQDWIFSGVMFNGTDLRWVHVKDSDKYKYNTINKQDILKVISMISKTTVDSIVTKIDSEIDALKTRISELEMEKKEVKLRQSGRTTAIALKTISEAMSNPNTPIRIVDHCDNSFSNKHLCDLIQEIITSLNLKNIHVNQTKRVVYYYEKMTVESCIMQTNDFVMRDDVDALTTEQWNKFREYLRGCGYNIDDGFGTKCCTLCKSMLSDYAQHVVLDTDGDLFWKDYDPDSKGIRITKDQILNVINEVPEMKSNTCIMQPGDYVTIDTVERLKTSEWHAFRDYLKRCGHNISPKFGLKRRPRFSTSTLIVLDADGDLFWAGNAKTTGKEITFDQILSVL